MDRAATSVDSSNSFTDRSGSIIDCRDNNKMFVREDSRFRDRMTGFFMYIIWYTIACKRGFVISIVKSSALFFTINKRTSMGVSSLLYTMFKAIVTISLIKNFNRNPFCHTLSNGQSHRAATTADDSHFFIDGKDNNTMLVSCKNPILEIG